uniref:Peptide synthase/polyketide synthase n=1 Tax=Ganoderma boninense TaxID=34458 RepID=A0A5K1K3N6_9APHY|nr:Putative peptide synthase/polyketide synthase [Ganoderma boninense]
MAARRPITILIVNPNSSVSMTEGLEPILADLLHPHLAVRYLTGPQASPPSVNDLTTSVLSAAHTLPSALAALSSEGAGLPGLDAVLVACFSDHPLVGMLKEHTDKPVLGIFEASVMHALALGQPFGIVTTGKYWEEALTAGVERIFGSGGLSGAFVGVESTGMTALELHDKPSDAVAAGISAAASRIVARGVRTIIMGCAGMSGMAEAVREGCGGGRVQIVDAVRSGVTMLEGLVRAQTA